MSLATKEVIEVVGEGLLIVQETLSDGSYAHEVQYDGVAIKTVNAECAAELAEILARGACGIETFEDDPDESFIATGLYCWGKSPSRADAIRRMKQAWPPWAGPYDKSKVLLYSGANMTIDKYGKVGGYHRVIFRVRDA